MAPPKIVALDSSASQDEVTSTLTRDGVVIIKDFVPLPLVDELLEAVEPLWAIPTHVQTEESQNDYHRRPLPDGSSRLYGLLHKIPDQFVKLLHLPMWRPTMESILKGSHSTYAGDSLYTAQSGILLANDIALRLKPGAPAQKLHRDQFGYLMPPDPANPIASVALVAFFVACCDTTFANGATQVIVGSHRWDPDRMPKMEDVTYAEMTKGSAMFLLGQTYHAGGANQCEPEDPLAVRTLIAAFAQKDTLRPLTDMVVSTPWEVAMKLPKDIQKICGYCIYQFPFCISLSCTYH